MLKAIEYQLSSGINIGVKLSYNGINLIQGIVRDSFDEQGDIEITTFNPIYVGAELKSVDVLVNESQQGKAVYSTVANKTIIELDSLPVPLILKPNSLAGVVSNQGQVEKIHNITSKIKRKIVIEFKSNVPKEAIIYDINEHGDFIKQAQYIYNVTPSKTTISKSSQYGSSTVEYSQFDSSVSPMPITIQKNLFLILSANNIPDLSGFLLPEAYSFNSKNYKKWVSKSDGYTVSEVYKNQLASNLLTEREVVKPPEFGRVRILYSY